ncbi:unnamed protein product [Prorocentrum cordatum]|uniref:type I protein arginine methyltransferase n=1 Tax=Prorocentrum cordatum TaxID=2364126 RepID=A0ABN9SZ22_9DINO|nr:unnamed protein product [Polarella glacialis]
MALCRWCDTEAPTGGSHLAACVGAARAAQSASAGIPWEVEVLSVRVPAVPAAPVLECPWPGQVELRGAAPQVEASARACKFEAAGMRWVPSSGSQTRVAVRTTSVGKTTFVLDDKELPLSDVRTVAPLSAVFVTMEVREIGHIGLQFDSESSAKGVVDELTKRKQNYERFEQYDQNSVQSYFQYYAKLSNQQNMLQDSVRTSIYQRAIVENPDDFKGKVAMDIGAGSGILSFFACQAGASTVYAVEASSMGEVVRLLADANASVFPGSIVEVLNKFLETIADSEIQGKVDVLVSEPIGTFLFNERMIETYLCARDRFLKPGGKMFPNVGNLSIAPFSDAMLHHETQKKNEFWKNDNFYGLNLNAAVNRCTDEHFRQPVVDYINPDCLVAKYQTTRFDFMTISIESLQKFEMPFDFEINQPCLVHGMAGWFDAVFEGSNATVVLDTAPWCPGTHWYQIRFPLGTPLAVNAGQHIVGTLVMEANNLQSYYVKLRMQIKGTDIVVEAPCIDLKDPEYRFYTSASAYCPPGTQGVFGQQAPPAGNAGAQQAYQQAHYAQSQQVPPSGGALQGAPAASSWQCQAEFGAAQEGPPQCWGEQPSAGGVAAQGSSTRARKGDSGAACGSPATGPRKAARQHATVSPGHCQLPSAGLA